MTPRVQNCSKNDPKGSKWSKKASQRKHLVYKMLQTRKKNQQTASNTNHKLNNNFDSGPPAAGLREALSIILGSHQQGFVEDWSMHCQIGVRVLSKTSTKDGQVLVEIILKLPWIGHLIQPHFLVEVNCKAFDSEIFDFHIIHTATRAMVVLVVTLSKIQCVSFWFEEIHRHGKLVENT